jgi:signal transduction histidine kinase
VSEAEELRASRARIASAARDERRRVERALHDGVQQDLIAVAVRLQLLRQLAGGDAVAALELIDELQRDVHDALDRVHELASGIYPSVLDARGLPDALREAGRLTGVELRVEAVSIGRYPRDVEGAVYFCCLAALQDAAPGEAVTIALREHEGVLRVELPAAGAAVRDLVEAAGGELADETTATIPLGSSSL